MDHHDRTPYLVRRARLLMGLTQEAFAQQFRVDPGTVSRWERGMLHPSPKVWKEIREIGLHASGPLADDVIKASPFLKCVASMENLLQPVTISKGVREWLELPEGDISPAQLVTPPSHPAYALSGARILAIIQNDPQWLKGGVIYAEGHCFAVLLKTWINITVAPLPDRDAALIELAPSKAGEDSGFWIRFMYTYEFFGGT